MSLSRLANTAFAGNRFNLGNNEVVFMVNDINHFNGMALLTENRFMYAQR